MKNLNLYLVDRIGSVDWDEIRTAIIAASSESAVVEKLLEEFKNIPPCNINTIEQELADGRCTIKLIGLALVDYDDGAIVMANYKDG